MASAEREQLLQLHLMELGEEDGSVKDSGQLHLIINASALSTSSLI